jgi:hypothetical protein
MEGLAAERQEARGDGTGISCRFYCARTGHLG